MPTSSVAGFSLRLVAGGGAEASLSDSQPPGRAVAGKKSATGLVRYEVNGDGESSHPRRNMGKVAIAASPHPKNVFALSSPCQALIIRFIFAIAS